MKHKLKDNFPFMCLLISAKALDLVEQASLLKLAEIAQLIWVNLT